MVDAELTFFVGIKLATETRSGAFDDDFGRGDAGSARIDHIALKRTGRVLRKRGYTQGNGDEKKRARWQQGISHKLREKQGHWHMDFQARRYAVGDERGLQTSRGLSEESLLSYQSVLPELVEMAGYQWLDNIVGRNVLRTLMTEAGERERKTCANTSTKIFYFQRRVRSPSRTN